MNILWQFCTHCSVFMLEKAHSSAPALVSQCKHETPKMMQQPFWTTLCPSTLHVCTLPLVWCLSSMGQQTSSSNPSHLDLPCTPVAGLTPLQGSPSFRAAGEFPSGDSWEASGSSERMVPSSDTWDFSVSLSIPVFNRGKAQKHK